MSRNQYKTPSKYGRTLLLKPVNNFELTPDDLSKFVGVVSTNKTKTTGSYFVTFDSSSNAMEAYNYIKRSFNDVLVKYSYYRVFFTMTGLTDTSDYNSVKQQLVDFVETSSKSSVLFFKLYKKGGKFIGCGDFTLDTLDGMNVLLNRETGLKTFALEGLTGSFYRYNSYKSKDLTSTM
jgi:hypothetical protein